MQRTFILAAVAALALAAAPAAAAKEIKQAQVCGPDACSNVDDDEGRAVLMNGGPPRRPPAAAPYYDVRVTMQEGDDEARWSFAAVPERNAMRADDGSWLEMPPEMSALVKKVAGDKRAFPAWQLIGAAPPPDPRPAPAAGSGNLLWPEGALIGLAVALAGALLARAARASGRFRPASS